MSKEKLKEIARKNDYSTSTKITVVFEDVKIKQ